MTEQRIFELLLQNNHFNNENKQHIYPTLIPEAVGSISEKLTNILYDSCNVKSSSRRTHLLKFLQGLSSNDEGHHYVDGHNYSCVLKHLEENCKKSNEVEEFLKRCEQEIKQEKLTLSQKIIKLQRTRSNRQKQIAVNRESRVNKIREKLNKLEITCSIFQATYSTYEPSENFIRELLGDNETEELQYHNESQEGIYSRDYRLKQIRFGYAVNNIATEKEIKKHFENILDNLSSYKELYEFEKLFLKYLFKHIGKFSYLNGNICEQFFFILEIDAIDICTQIIQYSDAESVQKYFQELETTERFINLKKICCENDNILQKIKNVLYCLYSYSYCNSNILKLIKLLNDLYVICQ